MKKISIIVPVFNAEKYLNECLESIRQQEYKNIEILMVYTQSNDQSLYICDLYSNMDRRFHLIIKNDSIPGAAHARNIGLQHATGEYIGFVDSDDVIAKDMFSILMENITYCNGDISILKETRNIHDLNLMEQRYPSKMLRSDAAKKEFIIGNLFYGEVWNKLYRKAMIKDLTFDESLTVAEDLDFVWKAIGNSEKIIYSASMKYFYRTESNGLTSVFLPKYAQDTFRVFQKIEYDLAEDNNEVLKELLQYRKKIYLSQCYLSIKGSKDIPKKEYEKSLKKELKKYKTVYTGKKLFKKRERLLAELISHWPSIGGFVYKCYKNNKKQRNLKI